MAEVGEAVVEDIVLEMLRNFTSHDGGTQGDISGIDPLCHGHDIGDHIPVIAGKPLPRPSKSRHDLVEDQQNPVFIADLPQSLQITIRGDDTTVTCRYDLHHDRCYFIRPLNLYHLPYLLATQEVTLRILLLEETLITVRIPNPDKPRNSRFCR